MLSLCLLSACAPQTGRFQATPAPSRAPQGDPAHDAQRRLLQEAHRAFVQERYPAAALLFKRFTDHAQDSPRLAEARWWLGRTYEQLGDYHAAMAQYRLVAGSVAPDADGALYEGHALRRLDELRRLHAGQNSSQTAQLALRMTVDQLPSSTGLLPWFQELMQTGVTAVVIAPALAPMSRDERFSLEAVREIANEAHRLGLLLWVALDLHQGHGMDVRPEWMVTTRHGARHEDTSMSRVDIANPAYQSYLEAVIRMLADTGCDGVFLVARSTAGFAEEFSDDSLRLFAASFGLSGSPEEIFGVNSATDTKAQEQSANYWRWVGWKARSYAQLVVRLRTVLRERNPTATLSVEVHQSSLTNPLQGLEQFGEDVAELSPKTGGPVVVRHEGTGEKVALEKLGRQLGTPDRVWIEVAVKAAPGPLSMGELKQSLINLAEFSPWNLVIHSEVSQAVP